MRKGKKISWLEMAVLGILGTLKLASNAPAQEARPAENPLNDSTAQIYVMPQEKTEGIPKPVEDKKLEFYLENTAATDYVFGNGMVIGRKPGEHRGVNQTLFSAAHGNLNAFVWSNVDRFQELSELDLGIDYTIPFGKYFSATGGYYMWIYPSKFIGDHSDHVLHGALNYKGPVNVDVGALHLLEYEDVDSGTCLNVKLSKEFPLGKLAGFDISATPSLEAGLTNRFYDKTEGLKAVTPGIDITLSDGGPLSMKFFYKVLDGKNGVENIKYGGVSLGCAF